MLGNVVVLAGVVHAGAATKIEDGHFGQAMSRNPASLSTPYEGSTAIRHKRYGSYTEMPL
jgi:hypothetical protein